jgi:hypothetical protein
MLGLLPAKLLHDIVGVAAIGSDRVLASGEAC